MPAPVNTHFELLLDAAPVQGEAAQAEEPTDIDTPQTTRPTATPSLHLIIDPTRARQNTPHGTVMGRAAQRQAP
jgi:hypothetical protein